MSFHLHRGRTAEDGRKIGGSIQQKNSATIHGSSHGKGNGPFTSCDFDHVVLPAPRKIRGRCAEDIGGRMNSKSLAMGNMRDMHCQFLNTVIFLEPPITVLSVCMKAQHGIALRQSSQDSYEHFGESDWLPVPIIRYRHLRQLFYISYTMFSTVVPQMK